MKSLTEQHRNLVRRVFADFFNAWCNRLYLESLICYYNTLCCNMLWLRVHEENPGTLWIFCVGSLAGPEIILYNLPFPGKFLYHCDCLQFGVILLISEVYCCLYSLPPSISAFVISHTTFKSSLRLIFMSSLTIPQWLFFLAKQFHIVGA